MDTRRSSAQDSRGSPSGSTRGSTGWTLDDLPLDDEDFLVEEFGIQNELELLPLLRKFLVLPPGWSRDPSGRYVDSSGSTVVKHPAQGLFEEAANVWRARSSYQKPSCATTRFPSIKATNRHDVADKLYTISPPQHRLHFKSWFHEGACLRSTQIRRQLSVDYEFKSGCFYFSIQGTDKIYQVSHILNRKGVPLDYIDLHVGAVIEVLGKPTTLMQADMKTALWIEEEAKQLAHITNQLCAEMRKYGLQTPGCSTSAQPIEMRRQQNVAATNLRREINQLENLYAQLIELRPKAAEDWAAKIKNVRRQRQKKAQANRQRGVSSVDSMVSPGTKVGI